MKYLILLSVFILSACATAPAEKQGVS